MIVQIVDSMGIVVCKKRVGNSQSSLVIMYAVIPPAVVGISFQSPISADSMIVMVRVMKVANT